MELQLIKSVNPVVPTKGTNAGRTMYVINGKFWARAEPSAQDTHVVLEDVEVDGKTYTNVIGYSRDIQSKIKTIVEYDAAYSAAIASLLR